jgi:hypothetical protein
VTPYAYCPTEHLLFHSENDIRLPGDGENPKKDSTEVRELDHGRGMDNNADADSDVEKPAEPLAVPPRRESFPTVPTYYRDEPELEVHIDSAATCSLRLPSPRAQAVDHDGLGFPTVPLDDLYLYDSDMDRYFMDSWGGSSPQTAPLSSQTAPSIHDSVFASGVPSASADDAPSVAPPIAYNTRSWRESSPSLASLRFDNRSSSPNITPQAQTAPLSSQTAPSTYDSVFGVPSASADDAPSVALPIAHNTRSNTVTLSAVTAVTSPSDTHQAVPALPTDSLTADAPSVTTPPVQAKPAPGKMTKRKAVVADPETIVTVAPALKKSRKSKDIEPTSPASSLCPSNAPRKSARQTKKPVRDLQTIIDPKNPPVRAGK